MPRKIFMKRHSPPNSIHKKQAYSIFNIPSRYSLVRYAKELILRLFPTTLEEEKESDLTAATPEPEAETLEKPKEGLFFLFT